MDTKNIIEMLIKDEENVIGMGKKGRGKAQTENIWMSPEICRALGRGRTCW